jgi:hypothetical protein
MIRLILIVSIKLFCPNRRSRAWNSAICLQAVALAPSRTRLPWYHRDSFFLPSRNCGPAVKLLNDYTNPIFIHGPRAHTSYPHLHSNRERFITHKLQHLGLRSAPEITTSDSESYLEAGNSVAAVTADFWMAAGPEGRVAGLSGPRSGPVHSPLCGVINATPPNPLFYFLNWLQA